MKKKLFGLFLVFAMLIGLGFAINVKAEEGEDPVVYTSSVVINTSIEHGDVAASITEGNVGDIVTISVEPSILYVIEAVYANGTQILTNEDGLYQFALIEGENTVNAKFTLNSEALEALAEMMDKAKNEGFDSLFTPRNIVTLVLIIIDLLGLTGLLAVVGKLKKANNIADDLAAKEVKKTVPETLENTFKPFLLDIKQSAEQAKEGVITLARCFILDQEGTPEARLAIIDELTKVQNANEEVADKVVEAINGAIEKAKELQDNKIKAIQELEQANNNLLKENVENEPTNDTEGRY